MIKKILKYIGIGLLLFISLIVWMLFIQPKIDHKRNLNDLANHIEFYKTVKHPKTTSEIYYKAFFGNSTGTSNHCEHIIVQIRKYNPTDEKEIADYYKKHYPELIVTFIKSIEDCCGDVEYGYKSICMGYFVQDQPTFTFEEASEFLPVYTVEYWDEGSHLSDWECN